MSIKGRYPVPDLDFLLRTVQRLDKEFDEGCILEIGVLHGRSLINMSLYTSKMVYGIDKSPQLLCPLPDRIKVIKGDSARVKWDLPICLLHIDGDHSFTACNRDFLRFSPYLVDGGYVAFHDYGKHHVFPGVKKTVDRIIRAGKYKMVGKTYSLIILKKGK